MLNSFHSISQTKKVSEDDGLFHSSIQTPNRFLAYKVLAQFPTVCPTISWINNIWDLTKVSFSNWIEIGVV